MQMWVSVLGWKVISWKMALLPEKVYGRGARMAAVHGVAESQRD